MDRRTLLARLLAGLGVAVTSLLPRTAYGYVDVERAQARGWWPARVYLDGVDVSNDCAALDDREGWVELMERDARGRHFIRAGQIAKARRAGVVAFIPKGKG
jgi:hypothetical protein